MDGSDSNVFIRLVASLTEAGISFSQTHHAPVYTSQEAAEVRGTDPHSGAKALIVKPGTEFALTVMPADLSLHSNAFRKLMRCGRLRFATKEEVFAMTGLTPGSIPPFGSLFSLPTFCDERLAENELINFNAGSHTDSIQMRYEDYISYESPRIARLAR